MCCFNRRMPRVINNNLVVVPAVPVQAGACGSAVVGGGTSCMPSTCMPCGGLQNGSMMNNCVPMDNCSMMNTGCSMNSCIPSGTSPAGNLSGFTCNANFETTQCVMEQPLMCAPTIINHHNRVQHMVPCIKTNIHNVHNHHEWLPFEQSEVNQVVNHTHGARPSDQQLCNSV